MASFNIGIVSKYARLNPSDFPFSKHFSNSFFQCGVFATGRADEASRGARMFAILQGCTRRSGAAIARRTAAQRAIDLF